MRDEPFRIGLIGCGRISDIYLENLKRLPGMDVVTCASLDLSESQAKAAQHNVARAATPEDVLADPNVDAVLNLTIPASHAGVSLAAIEAGKHVYSEKPLVTDLAEGRRLIAAAKDRGVLVGCAPDTFLGGRWQAVRRLIDEGAIGAPTGVFAHVGTHGTERHHPNPDFYYADGGGPLLDLGPYYLTAMVFCLGPISRVAGLSRRTFPERMIENGPRFGQMMPVDVDTHSLSLLEFESGAIGDMTMSFDIWDSETPRLEIYGEEGTICIPDTDPVHGANIFGGEIWLRTRDTARWTHQPRPAGRDAWQVVAYDDPYTDNSRGVGLYDLAQAVREGREPRASGTLALHVFEVMDAIARSQSSRTFKNIQSRCERPDPLQDIMEKEAARAG